MKTITVKTGRSYNIIIEHNILDHAGAYIRPLTKAARAVIVSDTNVAPIYAGRVRDSLELSGFEVSEFVFEAGEESKRLSTIEKMYMHFYEHDITRTDIVVALGGGVTGDMAGFAAASYLRGIDFVQIPTSLLAQVDSSVGGKTGVDLPTGKNLVGAFWQPILVLIDPETLVTLPGVFFRDGLGEVVKYGCIRSRSLFERLEQENAEDFIDDIIYECISIKADVVQNDERDTGERAILNFGHTLGHALEKLNDYSGLTHGEAVAAGAAIITRISEKHGLTETGTSARLDALLQKYGLPTEGNFPLRDIVSATRGDKKSSGTSINFVFLRSVGVCFTQKIDISDFDELFELDTKGEELMLRLRPYKPCDAEHIVSWIGDEFSFRQWCSDRYEYYPITANEINIKYYDCNGDCGDDDNFYPMTAFDGSGIVGHLILRFVDPEKMVCRLGFVIVDDTKRGMGYGKAMVKLTLKYVFEILGAEKATIGVFENNPSAYYCYKAAGFEDVPGGEPEHFNINGEDWLCLELELTKEAYDSKKE